MDITNKAKKMLEYILAEQDTPGIRIYSYSKDTECCGPPIDLSLGEPTSNDTIQNINGIQVAIEETILLKTKGLILDVKESSEGAGFILLGMDGSCC